MRRYKQAHHNPKRIPYGWRIALSGHHMVDSLARKNIMSIVAMRRGGFTLQKIKDTLESQNLPSPRNGLWHCTTIKKIFEVNSKNFPSR
ncbi:MAG: hypothetical protein AB8B92_08690 [Gammaproteobacteria bacterium]